MSQSRFKTLDEGIKQYLLRMYGLYEEGKLTYREEVQLFQDLLDSGMVYQMGPDVLKYTQRLLNVKLIEPALPRNKNAH